MVLGVICILTAQFVFPDNLIQRIHIDFFKKYMILVEIHKPEAKGKKQ